MKKVFKILGHKNITFISFILTLLLTIIGCSSEEVISGGSGSNGSGSTAVDSVTLSWIEPTTNANGTPLTDLYGYIVYYGPDSGNYTESIDVGNFTGASISSLSPGTWCFSITAYDTSGNESGYSNEVCKITG